MPGNQAAADGPRGEVELKVGYMTKRSQGKSALGAINFKKRVFVLTPNRLSYFDGTIEVRRREGREREREREREWLVTLYKYTSGQLTSPR